MPTLRRTILLLGLVPLLALPTVAGAHETSLVATTPPDGARVVGNSVNLVATYSGPVTAVDAVVEAPSGRSDKVTTTSVRNSVRMRVRFIMPGLHVIRWRVPQADGHLVDYRRTISVTSPQLVANQERDTALTELWRQVCDLLG